jgi:uncharacterized protein YodC (DUF2158 family)
MKFRDGEVVVNIENGNAMTVFSYYPENKKGYKCAWFIGNKLNIEYFEEDNLMLLDEWNRFIIQENRNKKINEILT